MLSRAFRTVLVLAPAAFVVAAITGCDANLAAPPSAAPTANGSTPAVSKGATPTAKVSTPAVSKSAGPRPEATVAACRDSGIAVTVTAQTDLSHGNTRIAMVHVENTSKKNCVLDGWTSVSLVNAENSVVPVRTVKVKQPGAPVPTTIVPGGGAWAGIKWTACDKADDSCQVGNTLRVSVQGSVDGPVAELAEFPSPETSGITMKSLQIGSVQPIRTGVVSW